MPTVSTETLNQGGTPKPSPAAQTAAPKAVTPFTPPKVAAAQEKAVLPVKHEFVPTPETLLKVNVNKLVKALFTALDMADYANVKTVEQVVKDAFAAARQVNYESALLVGYDPFAKKSYNV